MNTVFSIINSLLSAYNWYSRISRKTWIPKPLFHFAGSLNDCLYLHVVNFRIRNTKAAATMSQHGIHSWSADTLSCTSLRPIFICFAISFWLYSSCGKIHEEAGQGVVS